MIDGHVYRGATGAAAEIGHILVGADLADGAPPPEGFRSPARSSASRRAARWTRSAPSAASATATASSTRPGPGDPRALDALRIRRGALAVGVANLVNVLEPDVVAIGGGVSAAGDLLLGPLEAAARGYMNRGVGTRTEIRVARYGPEAGVLGAALMAGQELLLERDALE